MCRSRLVLASINSSCVLKVGVGFISRIQHSTTGSDFNTTRRTYLSRVIPPRTWQPFHTMSPTYTMSAHLCKQIYTSWRQARQTSPDPSPLPSAPPPAGAAISTTTSYFPRSPSPSPSASSENVSTDRGESSQQHHHHPSAPGSGSQAPSSSGWRWRSSR